MADTISPAERSAVMARIRSKGTKPEMVVRRMVHGMGYRYRLHRRDLPGTPDLVFPGLSKVIFVHGCFWHLHQAAGCGRARLPKSRVEFWVDKLEGNRARDARQCAAAPRRGMEGATTLGVPAHRCGEVAAAVGAVPRMRSLELFAGGYLMQIVIPERLSGRTSLHVSRSSTELIALQLRASSPLFLLASKVLL